MGKLKNINIAMLLLFLLVQSCTKEKVVTPENPAGRTHELNLSDLNLFDGALSDLTPNSDVFEYELATTLFTDHAYKQRLIKLPSGTSLEYNGELDPIYPNGTILAKTFYYWNDEANPGAGKQIIETRILLKRGAVWRAANYRWNAAQTDATLTFEGDEFPITWVDGSGATQNIDYQLPSYDQCLQCHLSYEKTIPIGTKIRNLNFTVPGDPANQLEMMRDAGMLTNLPDVATVSSLPDWNNLSAYTNEELSRGYMDVNCAHCHSPGGPAEFHNLDLRHEALFDDSGIYAKRHNIVSRFGSVLDNYRMPKLGRTVVHQEAYDIIEAYVDAL